MPIISDALETITSDITFNGIQALIFKALRTSEFLIQDSKLGSRQKVEIEYFNIPVKKESIVYNFEGGIE